MSKRRKPPKPSRAGNCIFCGSFEQELTAEHLFADWISWSLYPNRRPKQHILWHRNPVTGSHREWKSASIDFKKPQLCNRCNNVTLSGLENEWIKPLLEPIMMRLQPTVLGLQQQRDFAAWIVSRMIVYNHMWDDAPNHFYGRADRKRFIETLEPPEDVAVWIGAFVGIPPTQNGPILGELASLDPKSPPETAVSRKYTLTFGVRHFGAQLIAVKGTLPGRSPLRNYLMDNGHVVRWWSPRVFLPIWPPTGGQISWPPEMILAPGGYQQAVARFGGIDAPIFFGDQADTQDFWLKGDRPRTN